MFRTSFIVVMCALAFAVGCDKNKSTTKQTASSRSYKAEKYGSSTTQPSHGGAYASGKPTTAPSDTANINPLAGEWQLAIPRRHQQEASITAKDATHVTIDAGRNKALSGDYVVQGNYLLILTRDERLRPTAWKINSNDSLTLVRPPQLGTRWDLTGITLLRAPDDSATEADMSELTGF
jgi:hypothetical protein